MSYAIKLGVYDDVKGVVLSPIYDDIKDCQKGFKTKRGMIKGIYDYNGQKIVEGKFEDILPDEWAIVTVDLFNKWQIYDWCGKLILEESFDKIICKKQGFITFDRKNNKRYAYDYDGNFLVDRYGKSIIFHEKFIVLEEEAGDCYIYAYGKKEPIVNGKLTKAFQVGDIIVAKNEKGYGAYDADGNVVSEHKWEMIADAHKGCMLVCNFDGYYGVYDFKQQCVIPVEYQYAHLCDAGIAIYVAEQGYYPYDYQGRKLMTVPAQELDIEDNVIYRKDAEEWRAFDFEGLPLSESCLSKELCKKRVKQ